MLTYVYDALPTHFTSKERDSESGLDNFGKRYDASSLGRFMTTDPVVITTERLQNPQQLNLYAYVANNPLRFICGFLGSRSGFLREGDQHSCGFRSGNRSAATLGG